MHDGIPDGLPEELLIRWRTRRDAAALARLFDLVSPPLLRIALATAPDAGAAEEALQETFLALLEDTDRPDLSQPLMAWMTGVLRHKVADTRRRAKRVPDPLAVEPRVVPEDPADAAARRDAADRVRAAIDRLAEPYRSVAILRWEHGLEPAEIARLRNEPQGTVRSTLSRALDRLRRDLGGIAAIALVLGARPALGLASIRRAVLQHAGVPVDASGLQVAGTAISAGAASLTLCAVAAIAALGGGVTARSIGAREPAAEPSPIAVAVPRPEPPRVVPRATRVAAHDAGAVLVGDPVVAEPDADPSATVASDATLLLDRLGESWIEAWRVGTALSRLRPEDAMLVTLRARWTTLPRIAKQNVLKGFAFDSTCPRRLDVFGLGVADPDPRVQDFALHYVEPYVGRELRTDVAAGRAWLDAHAAEDPDALAADALRRTLGELTESSVATRADRLRLVARVVERCRDDAARAAVRSFVAARLDDAGWDGATQGLVTLASRAGGSAEWAEPVVSRLLAQGGAAARRGLLLAGEVGVASAWGAALDALGSQDAETACVAARVLADFDDARGVPPLIARLDTTSVPVRSACIRALERLTLLDDARGRDAAWWTAWWERDRARYESFLDTGVHR